PWSLRFAHRSRSPHGPNPPTAARDERIMPFSTGWQSDPIEDGIRFGDFEIPTCATAPRSLLEHAPRAPLSIRRSPSGLVGLGDRAREVLAIHRLHRPHEVVDDRLAVPLLADLDAGVEHREER